MDANVRAALRENASALRAMVAFRRADAALRRREGQAARAHGLTPAQFGVLDVLYAKGPCRIQQVIDATLSTSGNMTVVIRNMERDGLVAREPDPADRRSSLVSLTEEGRAAIRGALPDHARLVGELFAPLSEAERRDLARLLKKLV